MSSLSPDERGLSRQDLQSLAAATALSGDSTADSNDHVVEVARQILEMDFGYVSEFRGDEMILRATAGDGPSFDMHKGDGYPLDGSYDQRMVAKTIPSVVSDTSANDELRDLAITKLAAIGAYIGVPIYLKDGKLYGTFVTIAHAPQPDLDDRHVQLLALLSHIVASGIELQRLERDNERLRAQIGRMTEELDEAEEDRRMSRILTSGEFQTLPHGTIPRP
jgi:GAF domain-containing protein